MKRNPTRGNANDARTRAGKKEPIADPVAELQLFFFYLQRQPAKGEGLGRAAADKQVKTGSDT